MAAVCVLVCLLCWMVCTDASTVTQLSYSLAEELPGDTFVGNLVKDAGLDQKYDSSVLSQLRYEFLNRDKRCSDCFKIEGASGFLRSNKQIDRDVICPGQDACLLKVDITIQPVKYFEIIQVQISVNDKNDNTPEFPQDSKTMHISEATPSGTSFSLPSARDSDSPIFSVSEYLMYPELSQFGLVQLSGQPGSTFVQLMLTTKLDREKVNSYDFLILCKDGGSPARTGTLSLTVSVTDYNDHTPVFLNHTYFSKVEENKPPQTFVIQVKATDSDEGANAQISYFLDEDTALKYGKLFSVDNTTGVVRTRVSLDREEKSEYTLVVRASDQGSDPKESFTEVMVEVLDKNDNPPKITINNQEGGGVVAVPETNETNANVAHITIMDQDSGTNGEFSCRLDSHLFRLDHIYQSEYKLTAATALDRESRDSYGLILTCSDMGSPSLVSTLPITVKLLDVNDHRPRFSSPKYTFHIEENSPEDSIIGQVIASDADIGPNGNIEYRLHQDSYSMVSIEPTTGTIRCNYELNYELVKSFSFHVIAADSGTNPQSATCEVTVVIIDINDEKPVFTSSFYSFSLEENGPMGAKVGNVQATDADSPPYSVFTYSLSVEDDSLGLFTIDEQNGTIKTLQPLDRETRAAHYLKVIGTDQSPPFWRSTASVTIYVGDQNDNAPVIEFPNTTHDTVYVSPHAGPGTVICRILATDLDEGNNAKLTYSIYTGRVLDVPFAVHPITGDIVLQTVVTSERDVPVTVTVSDNGKVPLFAEASLIIKFNATVPPPSNGQHGGNRTSGGPIVDSPQGPLNQNIIIIIVLSVVFTVLILFLAAVLIVLRCTRRKAPSQPHFAVHQHEQELERQGPLKMSSGPVDSLPSLGDKKEFTKSYQGNKPVNGNHDQAYRMVDPGQKHTSSQQINGGPYERSISQVCNWLRAHSDHTTSSDVDSECSMQLSNSDSGRGTEEGEAGVMPGSRDTSAEIGSHQISLLNRGSQRQRSKRVCFSDQVTELEQVHGRKRTFAEANYEQKLRHPLSIDNPNYTNVPTSKPACSIGNLVSKNSAAPSSGVPPRPPRRKEHLQAPLQRRGSSVSEENFSDDASTTSGSYVIDAEDLGAATMV